MPPVSVRLARVLPTGLRRRLIVLVLASVLPFLLLVGIVARQNLVAQKPLAAERAMAHTGQVAEHVTEMLQMIETVMLTASASLGASAVNSAANNAVIAGIEQRLPKGFARWTLYDTAGVLIGRPPAASGWLEPEEVRALWRSKRSASPSFVAGTESLPGFGHAVRVMLPFRDDRGDSALLVTLTPVQNILNLLEPAHLPDLPEGSTITIITAAGIVIARSPDPDQWIGRDLSGGRPPSSNNAPRSGVGERVGDDGVERLIAFAGLETVPWRVYTGIPMSAIFAQARADFMRVLGYGGAALALALALAVWQAARIVNPLTRLSADAAKLGTGNLAHRSAVLGTDEMGTLARTINRMATTLEHQGAVLRESEERYRELFDINPLPMWVLDPATLAFLAVNRAAVEAYGYSEEEFLAMKVSDIRPPEDVPVLLRRLAELGDKSRRFSARHRSRDGTVFPVEINSGAIIFDGRPARLVVVQDVTERMQAEEALREAESRLRQSQRLEAVGQLTGGIAHDFNNVLTAIGSYSDFLYESLDPGDARRLDIQEIRKAADRAAGLTKQLLAFSRSQILQPRVLDVNESVMELESLLRRVLTADLDLVLTLDQDAGRVRADPGQLGQVLINLAVNARDAMPDGGVLTISSRNERAAAKARSASDGAEVEPGDYVVIEVSDTGTGMDAQTLQRIFEPFFTTKGPGKGTGLGLSTAYGIVHQSGGYISAESVVGRGTTFTIRLPRADQPVEPERPKPEAAVAGQRSEIILVVEDEDSVRRAIRRILIKKGYTVLEASNGNEALQVTLLHPKIDLLLTDLVMPGMGGRELVRALRTEGRAIPTLYMSGYTKDAVMRSELDPDIMVLEKPFSQADLAAKVREVLDLSRDA